MRYRTFGRTGWDVSEVGFGGWGIGGGWGPQNDAEARRALQRALDAGINFFDTAYVYGDGHSEGLVGGMLRTWRKPVYVATKIPAKNMEWPADPRTPISHAFPVDWIIRCTETSLKRLGLEHIDLQQLHVWTDAWVGCDEWREARDVLRRDGKIRAFGVSINDHEPDSAIELVRAGEVDSVQAIYNIFDQTPAEKLFPLCQERGVAVIGRVPFDEGSLTGALTEVTTFAKGDWRSGYFKGERLFETVGRVERLKPLLGTDTPTLSALALKFSLAHAAVSTVIPGMRTPAHVEHNAAAADLPPLTAATLSALKAHAWPRNYYVGAWH